MDHLELARRAHRGVHALQSRLDERAPRGPPHDESVLLAPVIAAVHGVDVVLERVADQFEIVVGDGVKEVVDELRVLNEIHQQVFHPAQRPRALEQGEINREHAEAVRMSGDVTGDGTKDPRVPGRRELIAVERWLGQDAALDHADVLVLRTVPNDAEAVADTVIVQGLDDVHLAAEAEDVAVDVAVEVGGGDAVVMAEFLGCLAGEPEGPGHIGRLLSAQHGGDDFAFGGGGGHGSEL